MILTTINRLINTNLRGSERTLINFSRQTYLKQVYKEVPIKVKLFMSLLVLIGAAIWVVAQFPTPIGFMQDSDWGHQLTGANQILFGEHPFIDYHSTYGPLTFYASALMQTVSGSRFIGELVLVTAGFSIAYLILFHLMWSVSRRLWLVAIILFIMMMMIPRLYKYYIVLMPVTSLLTIWQYIEHPSTRSKWMVAIAVSLTGLFRPDFGVYMTVTACLTILLFKELPLRRRLIDCFHIIVAIVASASPWLLWATLNGGLDNYFRDTFHSISHASGMARALNFSATDVVSLYIFFSLIPIGCLIIVLKDRSLGSQERVKLLAAILMAQLVFIQALHRTGYNHLAQAISIHSILWVYLADQALSRLRGKDFRVRIVGIALGIMLLVGAVILFKFNLPKLINLHPKNVAALIREFPIYLDTGDDFFAYVAMNAPKHPYLQSMLAIRKCTSSDDRLLGLPLFTSFNYVVERPFGGGQMLIVPGYFTDSAGQMQMINRMKDEYIPIVVYDPEWRLDGRNDGIMSVFAPQVHQFIEEHYVPARMYGNIVIMVRRDLSQVFACVSEI